MRILRGILAVVGFWTFLAVILFHAEVLLIGLVAAFFLGVSIFFFVAAYDSF
jgi:hypothetical protein